MLEYSRNACAMTPWISVHRFWHVSIAYRTRSGCIKYRNATLTLMASTGCICPFCQTLVIVPRAGMQDKMSVPWDTAASSSVGSNQMSPPVIDWTSWNIEWRLHKEILPRNMIWQGQEFQFPHQPMQRSQQSTLMKWLLQCHQLQ